MIDEAKVIRKAFKEKDAEIERLKALLTRAADALHRWASHASCPTPKTDDLIEELRKAAE